MATVRKHRLNPFKVLCVLLYGECSFVTWTELGIVEVRNGPFARLLRVPNYRLKEYLEWLAHWSYITELDTDTYGISTFRISIPENLRA